MVRNLDDVLREEIMAERRWRVFHHSNDSLVPLVVQYVELDRLWPHLVLLTNSNEFGDLNLGWVRVDMVA